METPTLNRRDMLKLSAAGTAAMAIPLHSALSAASASTLPASRMPVPYTQTFKAPPVLEPTVKDDIRDDVYGFVPADYVPPAGSEHYPGEPIRGSQYLGTDYYRITETNVQAQIIPGMWTKLWCYAGHKPDGSLIRSVPGPTIRSYLQKDPVTGKKMPRRTVMQVVNELPRMHPTMGYVPWTSLHLHGSPSKPQYDGYAGDLTNPGEWKNYEYPNNCTPRTLWYHDHGVHHTAQNVYMGLAAQYHLVDEDLERSLGIPRYMREKATPGHPLFGKPQYEFPMILSDAIFNTEGQLLWNDDGESGVYGDVVLVNGVAWPNMPVEPRKYRFRILNGALARGFQLRLSNNMPFKVIATDGGFMQFAQTVTTLKIGMAERYEIIIDFSSLKPAAGQPNTKVQLLNDGVANARDFDHTGKVMQFEVGPRVTPTTTDPAIAPVGDNAWPNALAPAHPVMGLQAASRSAVRSIRLHRSNGMWKINDTTWEDVVRSNYRNIFANPARDAIEIWDVTNDSGGWFHPLHIHLVDFKILSRTISGVSQPPRPEEKGPKDVVYVGENETVRLLMRFEHEDGRYMIHCHNLSHEDHDMMFQYQVGHHDVDCDAINSCPPKPLPAPPLVPLTAPVQAPPRPGTTDTSGTSETSGSSETSGTSGTSETTGTTPTEPTAPSGTESTTGTTGGGA
ncbi:MULTISPECIES: multicopper oxidase domain-containing protein [unclassified Blastococcus]